MNNKFIRYAKQNIDADDIKSVVKVLQNDILTQGAILNNFEKQIAKYIKAKYVICVGNGTQALHLSIKSLNLNKSDIVVVPAISFVASANCALYEGLKIVFCDVNKNTGLLDEEYLENLIKKDLKKKIKAIIPVSISGQVPNMEKIKKISKKNNIKIVLDGCHALGSKFKNSRIGSCKYEDISTFSFHPIKNITTCEGGAIATNNKLIANKIRILRNHGIERMNSFDYKINNLGYNYRLNEIQSALGISQLKKLEKQIIIKKNIARYYDKLINKKYNMHMSIHSRQKDNSSSWHLYQTQIDFKKLSINKKKLMQYLLDNNIETKINYKPIYKFELFKKLYRNINLSNSEYFYERTLSLPMHIDLTKKNINYILETINKYINENK